MSVPVRLATMAAGLVLAFLVAFGVGRVTGDAGADGRTPGPVGELEPEVHDMADMADPGDAGDGDEGSAPHGAGEEG